MAILFIATCQRSFNSTKIPISNRGFQHALNKYLIANPMVLSNPTIGPLCLVRHPSEAITVALRAIFLAVWKAFVPSRRVSESGRRLPPIPVI